MYFLSIESLNQIGKSELKNEVYRTPIKPAQNS